MALGLDGAGECAAQNRAARAPVQKAISGVGSIADVPMFYIKVRYRPQGVYDTYNIKQNCALEGEERA